MFDLVLVYSFSRVHSHYFTIVKELSPYLRIAVFVAPVSYRAESESRLAKLEETELQFLETLKMNGAEVVDAACEALVLAFPNNGISENYIRYVSSQVARRKTIVFESFGYGPQLFSVFEELGASKYYIYDENIFKHKIDTAAQRELISRIEIVEMGKSRGEDLFPEIPPIDYIVALPTQMILGRWDNRRRFLKTMNTVFKAISPADTIVLKYHNVRDGGNLYFKKRLLFSRSISRFAPVVGWLIAWILERIAPFSTLGERFGNWSNDVYFTEMMERTVLLSEITSFHNFNLELFLHKVRKGIITGISTCMWHGLISRLPVYNCDSQAFGKHIPNYSTYVSFYVPYCNGSLEFDTENFDKISESAQFADFLASLKSDISQAKIDQ